MPVTFDELIGSPTYSGSHNSISATRRGRIAWGDIATYYAELFPAAVGGIPQLPKLFPGSTVLFAKSVSFKPDHPDGDQNNATPATYTHAEVEVQYETIPYEQANPAADQILTRRFSCGGEMMTLRNQGVRWKGDDKPIPDTEFDASKIIPSIEAMITLHRVTPAYYTYLRGINNSLIGKVNDAEFEGCAAETVLYNGAEFTENVSTVDTMWSVELKFSIKILKSGSQEVGWNYAFDPVTGTWREFETMDGKKIYPVGAFDNFY